MEAKYMIVQTKKKIDEVFLEVFITEEDQYEDLEEAIRDRDSLKDSYNFIVIPYY